MSRVLLIKNANLYDPDPKGIRDILIVDEKVFSVAEHIDPPELSAPVEVVSADGKMVIPGYVDQHVHVIGGGSDADLVILDEEFLVDTVFVRGQKMVEYGKALVKAPLRQTDRSFEIEKRKRKRQEN